MNEEVFRPPDIVPFVGSLQTACDTFLMDDTYLRKGPCFESNTTDSVSGLQPSSSDRDHEIGFRKQSPRARRRCSTECGAPLIAFSDNQFRVHFRMNADTFEVLCSVLFQHVPKENPIRGRKPIPLDRKASIVPMRMSKMCDFLGDRQSCPKTKFPCFVDMFILRQKIKCSGERGFIEVLTLNLETPFPNSWRRKCNCFLHL